MTRRLSVAALLFGVLLSSCATGTAASGRGVTLTPVERSDSHAARHEEQMRRADWGGWELLFIGDSITEGWEGDGAAVWQESYGEREALNLGIGGDRTQHVLWRLEAGVLDGLSPRLGYS